MFEFQIWVNNACITWLAYSDISRGQTIQRIWLFRISRFHIAYRIAGGFLIEVNWCGNSTSSSSIHMILCWFIHVCNLSAECWLSTFSKNSEKSSALRSSDGVRFSSNEYANIFCVRISIFYHVTINHDNKIWIYFLIARLKSKNFLTKLETLIFSYSFLNWNKSNSYSIPLQNYKISFIIF